MVINRATRNSFLAALAVFAVAAFPAAALAGNPALSPLDKVNADVSLNGKADNTSSSTKMSAGDSPTVDSYSGTDDSLPPPVDCSTDGSSSGSSDSGSSGSGSGDAGSSGSESGSSVSDDCAPPPKVDECAADGSGTSSDGKSDGSVPAPAPGKDGGKDGATAPGKDSVADPCEKAPETVTPPATDTPTTETPIPTTTEAPVEGGGVMEEPEPIEVIGGGELPVEADADEAPVFGGGGPELPFTGLPLWYAIYGGAVLMLAGGFMWLRFRRAENAG